MKLVYMILMLCIKTINSYETYNRIQLNNLKIDYRNKIRNNYINNLVTLITNKVIDSAQKGENLSEYHVLKPFYDIYCKNKSCNLQYIEDIVNDIAYDIENELNLIFFEILIII